MRRVQDTFDVMAAMSAIVAAKDIATLWDCFCQRLVGIGFENILYGAAHVTRGEIIGDPQDALILHHGPQAYADVYLGEELYRHSPAYTWAAQNDGFVSWPETMDATAGPPPPEALRIVQMNAQFNVFAGFVGSLNGVVPGMSGVIGLSPGQGMLQPEADALWAQVGEEVEMLSRLLQVRIASLPHSGPRRPLTSRQREALTWSAQGKTMQDIAIIMDLSVATVEKHLRMAREALDAMTTAHAVQKATMFNLLATET